MKESLGRVFGVINERQVLFGSFIETDIDGNNTKKPHGK